MTALTAPISETYQRWFEHFRQKDGRAIPWQDAYRLSARERRTVARSIQQFQLGEWARGRGFVRRARAHPAFAGDAWFVPALERFIAEEQEHSGILGRFLDREEIPRLKSEWTDRVFRRLRKLAGLEACATVLVTAEVLAIPFYQALRDATGSRLLRAICVRILCDEAAHLNYQALTIGIIQRRVAKPAREMRRVCHAALFRAAAIVVWRQHHRVFRAAGWDFTRFWKDAGRAFAYLNVRIRRAAENDDPVDTRLD